MCVTPKRSVYLNKSEGAIVWAFAELKQFGAAAYDWMRSVIEKSTKEEKELLTFRCHKPKAHLLKTDPIKFPQLPQIMAAMLDEGNFEQKNAVFKDVLATLRGSKPQ